MNYVWAFVVGGAICVIGQLFIDYTKLTPARISDRLCGGGRDVKRRGRVQAAGGLCRGRGQRAAAGVRASAGARRGAGRGPAAACRVPLPAG